MKSTAPFLRVTIPLVFVMLISAFVAYRSGFFDRSLTGKKAVPAESSDQYLTADNSIPPVVIDSPPPASPRTRIMSSSSKSGYVFDTSLVNLIQFKLDASKKLQLDSVHKKPLKQKRESVLMSSSKSMMVITPQADTTKKN